MYIFFLVVYLLIAISLVLLIILQNGKGIDIGGSFFNIRNLLEGVGSHPTSDNLITRLTTILGILFFLLSLLLGNMSNKCSQKFHEVNNSEIVNVENHVPGS